MSRKRAFPLALALATAAVAAAATDERPSGGAPVERAAARVAEMSGVRTVHAWRGEELLVARTVRGAGSSPHDVKSASKSVVSALVGLALERGLLGGLDTPLAELLPRQAAEISDARKRQIRLRHLLTMTSGLAPTSGRHYGAWVGSRDWTRAALARPLEAEPGARFAYSTGNSHLVAAALARACRCDLLAWGREALFDPLGMTVASWATDPQGVRFGGNSFRVAPAALGRLGQLYLERGVWRGRRLLPESWIELTTRRHAEGWPDRYGAYGMLWWIPPFAEPAFMAVGYGGQFLIVAPERRAVVVVTSTHLGKGAAWDRELLARVERELLPTIGARDARAPTRAARSPGR